MNNILNLKIYTLNKLFLEEVIKKITVYGNEGCYTIFPNHKDYISSFDDGMLFFTKEDNEKIFVGLNQGILTKCGREIQISTFNAIYGGNSIETLKENVKTAMEESAEKIEIDKKIKKSLKQIELELFQQINLFGKKND